MEQNRTELFCFWEGKEGMTAQAEKKAPEVQERFGVAGIFERAGVTPADKAQDENRKTKEEVAPWVDDYAEMDPWDNRPLEVVVGKASEPMGKAIRVDGPISRAEAKKRIRRQYMGKVAWAVFAENVKAICFTVFFFLLSWVAISLVGREVFPLLIEESMRSLVESEQMLNALGESVATPGLSLEAGSSLLASWIFFTVCVFCASWLVAQVKIARRCKVARLAYKAEKY